MISVVWVTQVYPREAEDFLGGFLHRLARELPDRGVSVRVLAPHADGLAFEEERDGVLIRRFRYAPDGRQDLAYTGEMHRVASRHPLRFAGFLRRFRGELLEVIRSQRPALVHAHWWVPSGWIASGPCRRASIPLFVSLHGTDVRLAVRNPLARIAARRVLGGAERVLPVSRSLAAELSSLGIEERRVEVLSMPPDSEVFALDPSGAQRASPPSFVVAARLTAQKRVDFALRAASRVAAGVPFRFDIVGDGPEAGRLRDLAKTLGLGERVVFHGVVSASELARLYREASGVVLTSEREGYGLTLVEGALCGAPGVGVRSGGIEELIQPGRTGFLVEPDDEEGLAAALGKLASDPGEVERLGRGARELLEDRTAGAVAARLAELYRSVVNAEQAGQGPP